MVVAVIERWNIGNIGSGATFAALLFEVLFGSESDIVERFEAIGGKTAPITIYPTRATSARYQLDINPTNKNTAADTSIAIQIGEMVCA